MTCPKERCEFSNQLLHLIDIFYYTFCWSISKQPGLYYHTGHSFRANDASIATTTNFYRVNNAFLWRISRWMSVTAVSLHFLLLMMMIQWQGTDRKVPPHHSIFCLYHLKMHKPCWFFGESPTVLRGRCKMLRFQRKNYFVQYNQAYAHSYQN